MMLLSERIARFQAWQGQRNMSEDDDEQPMPAAFTDLVPGRAMDALVARHCFGHTLVPSDIFPPNHPNHLSIERRTKHGASVVEPLPHYTTTMEHAWLIAEHHMSFGCAAHISGDGHTGYEGYASTGHARALTHGWEEGAAGVLAMASLTCAGIMELATKQRYVSFGYNQEKGVFVPHAILWAHPTDDLILALAPVRNEVRTTADIGLLLAGIGFWRCDLTWMISGHSWSDTSIYDARWCKPSTLPRYTVTGNHWGTIKPMVVAEPLRKENVYAPSVAHS